MTFNALFEAPLCPWMNGEGPEADIVLSSRVRLARNLDGYPFPNRADARTAAEVVGSIRHSLKSLSGSGQTYFFLELDKILPLDRYVLVEKHITSPDHVREPDNRALVVRDDTRVSIMVNEEDHLRIQGMTSGLSLAAAAALANAADDRLEAENAFAFSEETGYLTACPTNVGTGLRASVMIHLPALVMTRQMNRIVSAATQLGLAVRGLYGEGTEAAGNIFQISNQQTLGLAEQEIIDNLTGIVKQIVDQERAARDALVREHGDVLEDRVWRAYGILRHGRSISGQEALVMLSEVRLGIDLGFITVAAPLVFNELLVSTRPNFLQRLAGEKELQPADRRRLRAKIIRDRLDN